MSLAMVVDMISSRSVCMRSIMSYSSLAAASGSGDSKFCAKSRFAYGHG